jgi:tetratricopeptide (TPR) repeat protein
MTRRDVGMLCIFTTQTALRENAQRYRFWGLLGSCLAANEAVAVEDSIYALSQPPYPIIPAHELYGTMLLEMKRPAEAMKHFIETLRRTPGRPKAIYGIARAAESLGDKQTAMKYYTELLELWKHADKDRPEIAHAQKYIKAIKSGSSVNPFSSLSLTVGL